MTRFAAGVVGLLALCSARANSPDPAGLAVPPEQADRARQLVRQLGSETYRDRDRAARELRGMGRLAVTVLAGAVAVEIDPEVRARCEDLLPAAEADDMAARAAAFLADADGRFDHDVPGWAEFRAAVGADPAARALFVAVLRNPDNHPLLQATRRPADRLPAAVAARRQRLLLKQNATTRTPFHVDREVAPLDPVDLAALLLAESLVPERGVPMLRHGSPDCLVPAYLYSAKARDAVAADAAFRRLVVNWLETRNGATGPADALKLGWQQLHAQLGPDAINRLAVRVLAADGSPAYWKMNAYSVLLKNDAKGQLPAVTRLFADDTLLEKGVPNTPSPDDLRMRDVALLVAVRLTGQNPVDYGFTYGPPSAVRPMNAVVFQPNRVLIGGENLSVQRFRASGEATADQKRAAAFKKWDEWAATNP